MHIASLLISPGKTGKVTKHLQDYLWFLSLPFNSPWAVTNYRVNLEDLLSVSWGKNLKAVNSSWKSPCSDLQKSRLLFSSPLHNISIFLSLNAACSAGAAGRFEFLFHWVFAVSNPMVRINITFHVVLSNSYLVFPDWPCTINCHICSSLGNQCPELSVTWITICILLLLFIPVLCKFKVDFIGVNCLDEEL